MCVCVYVISSHPIIITNCGIYERTGKTNMASSNRGLQIGSAWFQRKINLRPQHRGVHLVTEEILRQMPELGQFAVGLCHVQSKFKIQWTLSKYLLISRYVYTYIVKEALYTWVKNTYIKLMKRFTDTWWKFNKKSKEKSWREITIRKYPFHLISLV